MVLEQEWLPLEEEGFCQLEEQKVVDACQPKLSFKMFPVLRQRFKFVNIQTNGAVLHCKSFIVRFLKKTDSIAKVGFTVSKKIGNAVVRNLVKRRLREAVRLNQLDWLNFPYDLVIVTKRRIAKDNFNTILIDWKNFCALSIKK
jgi:ribonuclease P protein component